MSTVAILNKLTRLMDMGTILIIRNRLSIMFALMILLQLVDIHINRN